MRSERRHHLVRLKQSHRFHWGQDLRQNPVALGRAVRAARPCSCWMCSGTKSGEPSVKELRAREAWRKIELA